MSKRLHNKAKEVIDKMFSEARTIEDREGIIKMETLTKLSITPKDKTKLGIMYDEVIYKLHKRHLLKYVACYIDENKIILEKI